MVRKTPPDRVVVFRVANIGAREESLSNAYISVPGGGEVRPFSAGMPAIPSQLKPGVPIVFGQTLQGVAQALVNEGCTGTARVKFVARLGRGKTHRKRVEIPDVESEARG